MVAEAVPIIFVLAVTGAAQFFFGKFNKNFHLCHGHRRAWSQEAVYLAVTELHQEARLSAGGALYVVEGCEGDFLGSFVVHGVENSWFINPLFGKFPENFVFGEREQDCEAHF